MNMDRDERFWVDGFPLKTPFGEDTLGIVDEEAGGIIAYVGLEDNARFIVAALTMKEMT